MKDATAYAKKLPALLKKIKQKHEAEPPIAGEPVAQLIIGFLEWEASAEQADKAMAKLMEAMVDFNEVRVSLPHEIVAVLGSRYPKAEERAARMHDALQEVYLREHATAMKSLAGLSKKEVRQYLDTLPGITPYVAAQVTLLCFGGHAIPVDEKLASLLRDQQVAHPEATVEEIEAFLTRQVRAGDAEQIHAQLRAWVDAGDKRATVLTKRQVDAAKKKAAASAKKAAPAKTAKKKVAKKSKKAKTTKTSKSTKAAQAPTKKKSTAKKSPKASKTTKKKTTTRRAKKK